RATACCSPFALRPSPFAFSSSAVLQFCNSAILQFCNSVDQGKYQKFRGDASASRIQTGPCTPLWSRRYPSGLAILGYCTPGNNNASFGQLGCKGTVRQRLACRLAFHKFLNHGTHRRIRGCVSVFEPDSCSKEILEFINAPGRLQVLLPG